jgi:hypothetical protein
MNNWILRACWLIALVAFVVNGCGKVFKSDRASQAEDLTCGPDVETLVVRGDYSVRSLAATGGLDAWMKVTKLELDCVVTFYQPNGSLYLTEHKFEIYPWSNSIRISAQEPMGKLMWQLSNGHFNMLQGNERVDVLNSGLSYRDYAEAVLNMTTAPVRFLDQKSEYLTKSEPIKIAGLWYHMIEQVYPLGQALSADIKKKGEWRYEPYWSEVIFCQNRDSSFVSLLFLSDVDEQKFLAVRAYDYDILAGQKVIVPRKIEIFKTDAQAVLKDRLVEIDFK